MKNLLFIAAFLVGVSAFGQEEISNTEAKYQIRIRCGQGKNPLVIDGIPVRPLNISKAYFIKGLAILQPTETNELPNGTMPLSKDLPYVHTLRGYVYTADYLRYTPRY